MIRFASLFSQLVAIFDRGRFQKLVADHCAECHAVHQIKPTALQEVND